MSDNASPLARLAAIMSLFGLRFPEAPMPDGIIEGPFAFQVSFATGNSAAKDFLSGTLDSWVTGTLFAVDDKLNQNGFSGVASKQPGILFMDGIGLDLYTNDATALNVCDLTTAWRLTHTPQGAQRSQSIALAHFARIRGVGSTDTATERVVSDPFNGPYFPMSGGPWKINTQTDTLKLTLATALSGTGVTLAGPVYGNGRVQGVFIVESLAQELGILSNGGGCGPNFDKIADVIGGRIALRQPL